MVMPPSHPSPASAATLHIIGAGLAGLSCALHAAAAGRTVMVHEAARHAGGRCRSFHDAGLDRIVDNGSHLILSANRAVFEYLALAGAADGLVPWRPAAFPFLDLAGGQRWVLRPGRSRLPWWLLDPARRVPGSRLADYLAALRLARAPRATVAQLIAPGPMMERLWRPLCESICDTGPEEAAAGPLWRVLALTLLRGEAACRPCFAPAGLGPALIEPALAALARRGMAVRTGRRLIGLAGTGRIEALDFEGERLALGPKDQVVLALPAHVAPTLLPELPELPAGTIVNAHFRLDRPPALPGGMPFLGLVGGTAHWLFVRGDVVSVTVSAADRLAARPADEVAPLLWRDVAAALGMDGPPPPWRVLKERRATLRHSPATEARRPGPGTRWPNLWLAGDWTDTGLPCTIEGAVGSGATAARLANSA